jgi:hypothetical protein
LLLQEAKSPGRENLRTVNWMDVDQPHTPRVPVDRVNDACQDGLKGFIRKRVEEVSDGEIVGHRELGHVGDHDLYFLASVLTSASRQTGASDLGEGGGDLDPDDSAKGPLGGLMDDSALSAPEVDEGVAIGDPEIAQRSG